MRMQVTDHGVTLWLSANDTYAWSRGEHVKLPGKGRWPCSELANRRVVASFDSHGVNDIFVSGPDSDPSANEFNAITSDFLALKLPKDHPAYFVAVGQFERQ